ncbi:tRNA (guanosine(46)-N7)-methyltransferase TrmB [Alteromonadaceae bacterium BrNp21-10]|nr:tRNA (guanosine(46)-N7)-methyltransferase TrmB [Alteromonadaceae bacterium BrNp21-10]
MTDTNPMPPESHLRRIKSFVIRAGRLTNAQAAAIEQCWPSKGLEHKNGLVDFATEFGRQAPVVLEIGFGMGTSFVTMAQAESDKDFIGIEVHKPGVGACLGNAQEQGVNNFRIFEHDAIEILADCIADNSLSRVQLFFPDPWHKKRHHKRRIVKPEFVQALRQKLTIGGVFHMATDWENYAEHMLEVMSDADGFANLSADNTFVPRPDHRPLTKFEQRGHRLGHGVWDLMYERKS